MSGKLGQKLITDLFSLRIEDLAPGSLKEVELFIDCVTANSDPVELGGFIKLDRRFEVQMLSSIIIYLIVLVQFDIRK